MFGSAFLAAWQGSPAMAAIPPRPPLGAASGTKAAVARWAEPTHVRTYVRTTSQVLSVWPSRACATQICHWARFASLCQLIHKGITYVRTYVQSSLLVSTRYVRLRTYTPDAPAPTARRPRAHRRAPPRGLRPPSPDGLSPRTCVRTYVRTHYFTNLVCLDVTRLRHTNLSLGAL